MNWGEGREVQPITGLNGYYDDLKRDGEKLEKQTNTCVPWCIDSQSVVLSPAAPTTPGKLVENTNSQTPPMVSCA